MNALAIYDKLTAGRSRFVRVDELCARAAEAEPGLLPARQELEAEANLPLRDKKGLEKAQGEFLSECLPTGRAARICATPCSCRGRNRSRCCQDSKTPGRQT